MYLFNGYVMTYMYMYIMGALISVYNVHVYTHDIYTMYTCIYTWHIYNVHVYTHDIYTMYMYIHMTYIQCTCIYTWHIYSVHVYTHVHVHVHYIITVFSELTNIE